MCQCSSNIYLSVGQNIPNKKKCLIGIYGWSIPISQDDDVMNLRTTLSPRLKGRKGNMCYISFLNNFLQSKFHFFFHLFFTLTFIVIQYQASLYSINVNNDREIYRLRVSKMAEKYSIWFLKKKTRMQDVKCTLNESGLYCSVV